MPQYYVLDCHSPLTADHHALEVSSALRGKRWRAGGLFSSADERVGFHPPTEPIEVRTQPDTDEPPKIYPELSWPPIPLMSRRLVTALQASGVDNLQTYETQLVAAQGTPPPAADHYLAVNIIGLVAAADMQKSKLNPAVRETLISVDFHSLSVDPAKARGLLLFRLAENVSAVIVHEHVREIVEKRGIDTLTWLNPDEWAG
jgi:hypothetical protein